MPIHLKNRWGIKMSKYFYIDAENKDSFMLELLDHDSVIESDIDEISENYMIVYCDVCEDFEHLAFDPLVKKRAKKLIRVVFDKDGY